MRRIAFLAAVLSAAIPLTTAPRAATAAPRAGSTSHPYFDDQGTLAWYCELGAAREAARTENKLVFIEYGRRACCNCRVLVQRVLPSECVKGRLSALCVGLAADCDEPDPRVEAIFRAAMPDASMLPFVAVVSPDLEVVTGWSGSMDAEGCAREVRTVEAWRARRAAKAATVPAPRPTPAREPAAPTAHAPTPAPKIPAPAAPTAPASRVPTPVPSPAPVKATAPSPTPAAPPPVAKESAPAPLATSIPDAPPAAAHPTDTTASSRAPEGGASAIIAPTAELGTQAATLAASRALLARAEEASAQGNHPDALRYEREAGALPIRVDPTRWAAVLAKADAWAEALLAGAATAALAGHFDEAERVIALIERDAEGRAASIDALRGARAVKARRALDAAPVAEREGSAKTARTTFGGTRWETLFSK